MLPLSARLRRHVASVALALALILLPTMLVWAGAGDVNGDGRIDVADVLLVVLLADKPPTTPPTPPPPAADVAPFVSGAPQGNGVIDAADILLLTRAAVDDKDIDGDGLPTSVENRLGLSGLVRNSDGVGLDDGALDSDGDGMSNRDEVAQGTDPGVAMCSATSCNDNDPCTVDRCGSNGVCVHDPASCPLASENFEAGFTTFKNVTGDDIDWTRLSGPTPSRAAGTNTGPSADHTTGSGFYAYVEGDGNNSKRAFLQGPCIDLSTVANAEWTFFYHRTGSDQGGVGVGSLTGEVALDCGTQWTKRFERNTRNGDEGNVYRGGRVDLTPFVGRRVQLRLTVGVGFGPLSDIAVDDIRVDGNVVLPPVLNPIQLPVLQSPFPVTGKAKAGQRIEVFLDGVSRGVMTAAADGSFSFSVPVGAGSHTVWAQADENGRKSFVAENEKRRFIFGETLNTTPSLSSGLISTPTLLSASVAYTINNPIELSQGVSLRIPAGTQIRFGSNRILSVVGALLIEGTAANPVRLMPDTGVTWGGLIIESPEASRLSNVRIEGAGTGVRVNPPFDASPAGPTTLTNLTVVARGTGLSLGARATLDGSTITGENANSFTGAYVTSDAVTIQDTQFSGLQRGVQIQNGSPTLRRVTMTNNQVGLQLTESGKPLVTDSRITSNQTGIRLEPLGGARRALDPRVQNSDIVGNTVAVDSTITSATVDQTSVDFSNNWWGTVSPDAIAASIRDRGQDGAIYDPGHRVIFCPFLDAVQGTGLPTPTGPNVLCGRVMSSRTLAASQTYRVVGGLVVEPEGTLTVPAGATLEFDALPGASESRLEVAGRLDVQGTATSPAVFRSRGTSPVPLDWGGISLRKGGTATLRGARVEHATFCVHAPVASTLTIADSLLRLCGDGTAFPKLPAVKLGNASATSVPTGSITGTQIEPVAGDSPANGITLDKVPSFTLRNNTVKGADTAVELLNASPLLQGNLLQQSRVGLAIRDSSSPVVNGGNRIIGNSQYGIEVSTGGFVTPPNPVVNQNEISGNTQFNYAITGNFPNGANVVLDAMRNFWGVTTRFGVEATISDRRQDPNRPKVEFCPFLRELGGAVLPCDDTLPRALTNFIITTSTQLTPGAPYVISGIVTVDRGATLTIQPATTLRFEAGAKLVVNGALVAQSTAQDIVFRSNAASPTPGSWGGIEVGATSTGILIDGVTIQHAVTPVRIFQGGTAAAAQAFTVTRSVLRDFTDVGIRCGGASPNVPDFGDSCLRSGTISNNRIENFPASPQARVGAGILIAGGSLDTPAPTMTISSNTVRGVGTGIYLAGASPSLTANTIEQNNLGVDIRFLSSPRITGGNRIVNNGAGINRLGDDQSQPIVNGNAIFGNTAFEYQSSTLGSEFDPFRAPLFQNAEGNYWGTVDPVAIAAKVTTGTGRTSFPVDFVPFLNAEGGQPVAEDRLLIGVVKPTAQGKRTIPPGGDVLLLGSTLVPVGVTLEINSSRVLALPDRGIGVDGTLRLIGTATTPVKITPMTAGTKWLGIDIRPGSTGSQIDNVVLEHTNRSGGPGSIIRPGVIDVRGSNLMLSNTQITDYVDTGILAPRGAAVVYRDGATGKIDKVTIDNVALKGSAGRMGTGILIENASPPLLNSTVREGTVGIYLYGVTTSSLSGNTVTANDVGILIEGTRAVGQNPNPVINANSIFGNSVPSGPVENIVFSNFAIGQTVPINARGNFFGVTDIAGVLATIVFRGELPASADVSNFLASAGGPAVSGTQAVFTTRVAFESISAQSFVPLTGQTVTFTLRLLAQPASVDVLVFDEADRARATLLRTLPVASTAVGLQSVVWNGRDTGGRIVPDGAYKFVIRAQFGSTIDVYDAGPGLGTPTSNGQIPSTFQPFQNEIFKLPYTLGVEPPRPARVSLVVRPNPNGIVFGFVEKKADTAGCRADGTCFLAIDERVLLPGQSLLTWDGRDPNGVILSGRFRLDTTIPVPIQANAVAVQGSLPVITGALAAPNIEVKSNPYLIVPTLEQQTSIAYCLDRQAIVTMKLLRPGFSDPDNAAGVVQVLENRTMKAASNCGGGGQPHVRSFGGLDVTNPMRLQLGERGPYTFVIDAEDLANPTLRTRVRGVVNILRSATR